MIVCRHLNFQASLAETGRHSKACRRNLYHRIYKQIATQLAHIYWPVDLLRKMWASPEETVMFPTCLMQWMKQNWEKCPKLMLTFQLFWILTQTIWIQEHWNRGRKKNEIVSQGWKGRKGHDKLLSLNQLEKLNQPCDVNVFMRFWPICTGPHVLKRDWKRIVKDCNGRRYWDGVRYCWQQKWNKENDLFYTVYKIWLQFRWLNIRAHHLKL